MTVLVDSDSSRNMAHSTEIISMFTRDSLP